MIDVPVSSSRDLWSHGSSQSLRDLLASALTTLLLMPNAGRAVYFSSPWMSDFVLLDNHFRQFGDLFPDRDSQSEIRFSEYLAELSRIQEIRLITVRNQTSEAFLRSPMLVANSKIRVCFATDEHHEKGILAPSFYIEGSMNITYSGVNVRGEKVTYHADASAASKQKLLRAYLEFDRYWDVLRGTSDGK
jgi:hypothetical protein